METTHQINRYELNERDVQQRDALLEKMLESMTGLVTHFTIYLGDRLGYYATLARHDHLSSSELAALTGTNERYTREWLEQQTMYGILEVADPQTDALERRFSLPAGHAEVLTMPDSPNYLAPFSRAVVGSTRPIDEVLKAFRTGDGVPYEAYGEDTREGIAGMNRPAFMHELGQIWLPAMEDVHQRLSQPGARVADFGCGAGWSSIAMALAYPHLNIDGFDLDEPSIELARKNAQEYNVSDRVRFHVRDASDPTLAGQYDFVTAFECIHDMSDPVGALRNMRRLANGTGSVLVVDERVNEAFNPAAEDNEIDILNYGFSVLHCLPVSMAEQPSAAIGTVIRPETMRQCALDAGFQDVEILPIENFFWRLYRLTP